MGRKPSDKIRIDNPALREEWVKILAPNYFRQGLKEFSMGNVSAQLELSKATLYKHYSTHTEVLEEIIDFRFANIGDFDLELFNTDIPYELRYRRAIEVLVEVLRDISPAFLDDLKHLYPRLWERVTHLQGFVLSRLGAFYDDRATEGALRRADIHFLAVRDRLFIENAFDASFLVKNDLTLHAAVANHFYINFQGIFKPAVAASLSTLHEPSRAIPAERSSR